ncbi:uracil-DNA glycosylase [Nocardia sp. X0981]
MRDPEYRRTQHAHIYDRHIEPINRLVDELREESGSWMPYVAPVYGGTAARVLAIFRDPGPKTQHDKGSGMLSLENDDPSAERHLEVVEGSGLAATDLISWNAYPWYINRKPTSAEIEQGLDSLQRLIALLSDLVVVVAHGRDAQTAWRRFVRSGRSAGRQLEVVETYHTSRQASGPPTRMSALVGRRNSSMTMRGWSRSSRSRADPEQTAVTAGIRFAQKGTATVSVGFDGIVR